MKSNIIGLLILSCVLTTGCMDNFLDRNPYGSIDETTFFTQKEHADLAAMACYAKLQKLNAHWADAQLELGMTGDLSSAGFKDAQPFYVGSFNPNESNLVKGIWQRAYQGIAVCNKNIEGVKNMPDDIIDEDTRNKHLAEMYFIRAFWYFRLIQFYGDVPLRSASVLDPTNKDDVQLAATPKGEIIKQAILPDLEFAAQNLPDAWEDKFHNRATKGAAYAYLCEVYLYEKDYENAIKAGEQVDKYGYSLIENPGNVLRVDYEACPEIIFSVGFGSGVETYREFYWGTIEDLGEDGRVMRGDTYSGDYFYPSWELVGFYEAIDGKPVSESPYYNADESWKNRDPRFDATFFTIMDDIETTTGKQMKWKQDWLVNTATGYDIQKRGVWYGENTWNKRADIHLMLLPRVYLHVAEAYALKSSPDFAKCSEYIEKVRSRARQFALANREKYIPEGMADKDVLPAFTIRNAQEAMDAINYESRVELFAVDCMRYYDLKRWGTLKEEWPRVGGFTWDDKLLDLPYPADELNSNKNLQQHSGWGN